MSDGSEPPSPADILDTSLAGGHAIRGSSLRIAAQMGGVLLGTVSTPLVVRHLGPDGYGDLQTVASLMFIVTGITEGGMASLGVREYSTLGIAARTVFVRNLLGLRIALALVGVVVAVAFAVGAGYRSVLVEGTLLASTGMLVVVVQNTLSIPLMVQLRLGSLGLIDLIRQLATAGLMVALVLAGASLLPFYAVSVLAAALALGITVRLVRDTGALLPRVDPRMWLALLRQTAVYAAASALGVVYFQIAMLTMSVLSSAHERGIYAVPFRLVDLGNMLPWLLVSSVFPILARAARDDADRLRYALQRLFEAGLIVGGCVALLAVVGAPFAIRVVGGSKFDASIAVLQTLGIGIPATYLVATWSFALLSLRRYRALMACNAIALTTALLLSALLIPAYGARGAGVVTASLELLLAGAYGVALSRIDSKLRPSLHLLPRIAISAGLGLAAGLALPVPSIVAAAAACGIYLSLLFQLRAFPAEVWLALRGRA